MDDIITLHNENGEAVQFEFLDLIVYEDAEYVVFLPVDDTEEAEEVVILQLESYDEESDVGTYVGVCEEAVLLAVYRAFKERNIDYFEFLE